MLAGRWMRRSVGARTGAETVYRFLTAKALSADFADWRRFRGGRTDRDGRGEKWGGGNEGRRRLGIGDSKNDQGRRVSSELRVASWESEGWTFSAEIAQETERRERRNGRQEDLTAKNAKNARRPTTARRRRTPRKPRAPREAEDWGMANGAACGFERGFVGERGR